MNQAKQSHLYLIILLTILLFADASLAFAQEEEPSAPGVSLSAEAGFDGYYKGSFWLPVQVNVANNGPAIEGEIRITTGTVIGNDRLIYNAPISLPTQSDKRITLYVLSGNGSTRNYTVELLDENGRLMAQNVTNNLRQQSQDDLLYGVVSSDPGELDFLENVTGGRSDAAVAFLDIGRFAYGRLRRGIRWMYCSLMI